MTAPLQPPRDTRYRRVLWVALAINGGMFLAELVAGLAAGSVSLLADALDFLSDAANYGISLSMVGLALAWRARAAMLKGLSMGLLGLRVVSGQHALARGHGNTARRRGHGRGRRAGAARQRRGRLPAVSLPGGDSNMRSVWICSRNDALGNVAVMLAALGVFGTGTGWPDIIIASAMAALSLWGAGQIINHAWNELRTDEGKVHSSVPAQ
jgi:Co/Zn/Cd efflux system component